MKELFESLYDYVFTTFGDFEQLTFEEWFESNKDSIDCAIEKYLQEQGKLVITQEQMDIWVNEVKSANQMIVKITKLIQSS